MAFISIVDYKFKTIMDNTAQITSRKTVKDGNKTRVVEDYYEAVPYEPMRLKVAYDDGVKFTPDVKIQVNDLNKGKKQFLNLSGTGDKFKITVLVHNKEIWNSGVHGANGKLKRGYVRSVLNKWIRNMTPLWVVSSGAVDVKSGPYIITDNPSRKQTARGGYSAWELEFTKYYPVKTVGFNVENKNAKKAIASYKSSTTKKAQVKKYSSLQRELLYCRVAHWEYSKTKKVVGCFKYLQMWLKKYGFYKQAIDGWYGNYTLASVKAFQKKYSKKFKLKTNGIVDKATLEAMVKIDIAYEKRKSANKTVKKSTKNTKKKAKGK